MIRQSELHQLLSETAAAKSEHIRDLRVLVDQSNEREKQLAGMVRLVMEERFYRPAVTRHTGAQANRQTTDTAMLNDVSTFDEAADAKTMQEHDELGKEIAEGFDRLMREEAEYRAQRGAAVPE